MAAAMSLWVVATVFYGASLGMTQASCNGLLLDMAADAVDDMYDGCRDKMECKVRRDYLLNEQNQDKKMTLAWTEAEEYYKKKWGRKKSRRPSSALGKEQIMAIYIYSLDKPPIYLDFNTAVRSQRSKYKTTFRYHTLHFFLTDAIKTLRSRRTAAEKCVTIFRRVNASFRQKDLNKPIRFGAFTSGSMGQYLSAEKYGNKTCFEVTTCFGADISLYSKLGESEREVLIPPYELFKVTKIERSTANMILPCEVVYQLKSMGKTQSNLNCALFSN
ncbi:erythroblast NAD(P)(+)--arginine ADP-ribosyltransferase-like [Dunckerocampus dactyliophorus]|uniref:erythroblast NAD(P)(+)--arginine ADP-ribosyltransferase-like n=1 Tax=Dunckerocampus dactyliophorus TaxID=161453 RepID=UPI002404EEB0|nr:erythroblast NAD(P)(+)--arginine ADP-ribosyltransferase-like [Dunckerocampus dactyliophorus]